jgi:3-methyladenine DNA glycosylase AlkD
MFTLNAVPNHPNERAQDSAWVVAFVDLAKHGDGNFVGFTEMVLDNCTRLLGSRERFSQTGVGWILRELSRSDEGRVIEFVEANLYRFSREALKNATKSTCRPRWQSISFRRTSRAVAAVDVGDEHVSGS